MKSAWEHGGAMRVLDVAIAPLAEVNGALIGTHVTFREVTVVKALQDQLAHSRRELESAYEELQSRTRSSRRPGGAPVDGGKTGDGSRRGWGNPAARPSRGGHGVVSAAFLARWPTRRVCTSPAAAAHVGVPDGALIERLHTIVAHWIETEPILRLHRVLERERRVRDGAAPIPILQGHAIEEL